MEESKVTPRYGAAEPGHVIFECPVCKATTQRLEGHTPLDCVGSNRGQAFHFARRMRAVR